MRAPRDHHAGTGDRGGASAGWRGAAVAAAMVAAAALSLTADAAPASAAGGYGVTATIPVGDQPTAVAVDPATHAACVVNSGDSTVSVIDEATNDVTAAIPVDRLRQVPRRPPLHHPRRPPRDLHLPQGRQPEMETTRLNGYPAGSCRPSAARGRS